MCTGRASGVDVAIGARIEASGLGINLAGQASMLGRDGSGTTWIASDAEEADRIEAAIRSGEKPPGAAGDERGVGDSRCPVPERGGGAHRLGRGVPDAER